MDVRVLYGYFLGHTFTEQIKMSLHFIVYVSLESTVLLLFCDISFTLWMSYKLLNHFIAKSVVSYNKNNLFQNLIAIPIKYSNNKFFYNVRIFSSCMSCIIKINTQNPNKEDEGDTICVILTKAPDSIGSVFHCFSMLVLISNVVVVIISILQQRNLNLAKLNFYSRSDN